MSQPATRPDIGGGISPPPAFRTDPGRHTAVETRFVAAAVLSLSVLIGACGRDDPETTGSSDANTPIVFGVSLPLSGSRSGPGTAAQRGYEVWAAMINEAGGLLGRRVNLLILDNGSDPQAVVADYERLITVENVDLLLGSQSSVLVIPSSEVAARHGYAYVEPAGGAPRVFERGLTNLFFAQPARSARQADPFAEYVLSLPMELRPRSFAVVFNKDDPFSVGIMDRVKSLLVSGGLTLVADLGYPEETRDFSEYAARIAVVDPDVLVGGTQLVDSIAQIQAYREVGYQPRFAFFTSGPSLPKPFRSALKSATEGVFSAVSWFPEANEFENAAFVRKYVDMFGGYLGDIPEDAANAFTVGQVLRQAIENIRSTENAALIEELHRGRYKTVVGPLSFQTDGAPQGSYMLLQWQGDNYVIVGPGDRAEVDPLNPPKPKW